MSASKKYPHEEEDPEIEEDEDGDEEEEEDEDDEDEDGNSNPLVFGDMLDTILSRHFEYSQDDNTLSMAEIMLLIKQSLDKQNTILSELLRLKVSKYEAAGVSSSSAAGSRSSKSSHHETPEERAIRKQKEASRK